jgi:cytosine/uracil/thiamine/allantoin permease
MKKNVKNCNTTEEGAVKKREMTPTDLNTPVTMKKAPDWTHAVLQRMIIVFLGLLTLSVALQSCTTHANTTCSAYDHVEVKK